MAKTSEKKQVFEFWMVNRRSNKSFKVYIKSASYEDAKNKASLKFPFPLYQFEHE